MSLLEQTRDRVHELVREEELDEYLPEVGESLPWGLIGSIWSSLSFIGSIIAFVRADWVAVAILAALGLALVKLSPVTRTASQRQRYRLGRSGEIVPGAVVQVNDAWHSPDNEDAWPGLVLLSSDPAAEKDNGRRLRSIVGELWHLKGADRRMLEGAELRLAWEMYSEMNGGRRLPIPPALSQGLRDCWLVPTMLPVAPLRHGETLIYGLMLPDDESFGGSVVLPVELALPK